MSAIVLSVLGAYIQISVMQALKNWLTSGKNYHVGICIYQVLGSNQSLKTLFYNGKTDYSSQKLETELLKMMKCPPMRTITRSSIMPDLIENLPVGEGAVHVSFQDQWMPLYQEMNYLRHELDKYHGNEASMIAVRKDIAHKIIDLEQELMNIWNQADEYGRTGKLMTTKDEDELIVPEEALQKAKAIDKTKRNIRRNRQAMNKKPNDPKFAALYKKYKDYYLRLTGNEYQEVQL